MGWLQFSLSQSGGLRLCPTGARVPPSNLSYTCLAVVARSVCSASLLSRSRTIFHQMWLLWFLRRVCDVCARATMKMNHHRWPVCKRHAWISKFAGLCPSEAKCVRACLGVPACVRGVFLDECMCVCRVFVHGCVCVAKWAQVLASKQATQSKQVLRSKWWGAKGGVSEWVSEWVSERVSSAWVGEWVSSEVHSLIWSQNSAETVSTRKWAHIILTTVHVYLCLWEKYSIRQHYLFLPSSSCRLQTFILLRVSTFAVCTHVYCVSRHYFAEYCVSRYHFAEYCVSRHYSAGRTTEFWALFTKQVTNFSPFTCMNAYFSPARATLATFSATGHGVHKSIEKKTKTTTRQVSSFAFLDYCSDHCCIFREPIKTKIQRSSANHNKPSHKALRIQVAVYEWRFL